MLKQDHPIWMCGLRPFFFFCVVSAPLFIALWVAFLFFGLPLPQSPGGPFVWHAHELLFGFGLAAVAGFALTAIPEFTHTEYFGRTVLRRLAGLWLLGRLCFWSSGLFGNAALLLSAVGHLGFLLGLLWVLTPRIRQDPRQAQYAFIWGVSALALCVAGFYFDALREVHPARWLHAALGVLMVLIVVAINRISMRVVNRAIEKAGVTDREYRARPPHGNLAILCIGFYTLSEFVIPESRLSGWLAFAAAAAVFNVMGDWHVGRAFFRRWVLMLYGVYALMGAGYALIGSSLVFETGLFGAGRHLLAIGAVGLSIYIVICIAGLTHCGHELDERAWVPLGAVLIAASAIVRAVDGWSAAGILWVLAYAMLGAVMAPIFVAARQDGGCGCDGPKNSDEMGC